MQLERNLLRFEEVTDTEASSARFASLVTSRSFADTPSIDQVDDGGTYSFPGVSLIETGLFLKVGCVGELYIKTPSFRGLSDYRNFVKLAIPHEQDLRPLDEPERWDKLSQTLESFTELKPVLRVGSEEAHYLAIHKLQYERLRTQSAVVIPRAKFGILQSTHHHIFRRLEPALFQERVEGTTLWDMFDFTTNRVDRRWASAVPQISARLYRLLDSSLLNHIDWNIKNFVFNEPADSLAYVDMKPTTLLARSSNQTNLKGLRDHFIA